jgi:hypothetical protein
MVFAEVGPGPTLKVGPLPAVRIDGEAMRNERGDQVLAQHNPTSWEVQGRAFFRVDCASLVRLQFENPDGERSELSASFAHFSCADGIAYADGMIYGHIDLDTKRWFSHAERRFWHTLIVRSAKAPAA